MKINNRKITDLVEENFVYASVLHYFGIIFYDYSEKTLEQVCSEKGLNLQKVVQRLESVNKSDEQNDLSLYTYPIDLIIEYLKHTHYLFIKEKLPYIVRLIKNLKASHPKNHQIAEDLKFIFPLFVEDFIHHIYEEEDNLFSYILYLNNVFVNSFHPPVLFYKMEKYSIRRYATEHEVHDDEMSGIRSITNNYTLQDNADLHMKVVYAELEAFEKELKIHASVENEILFPKALMLEKEVKKIFIEKILLN